MRFPTLSKILLGASLSLAAACGDGSKTTRKEIKTVEPQAPVSQVSIPEPQPQLPVPIVEPVVDPTPQTEPMVLPETFEERLDLGKKLVKKGKLDDAIIALDGAI